MSLISKICVIFLIWTVAGAVMYFGTVMYWHIRGCELDPMRKEFRQEFLRECIKEMYACMGLPDPYVHEVISVKRSDPKTVGYKIESLVLWMLNGMVWPITVSCAASGFRRTYVRYKDEYDRGIRVRKEPS